MKAMALYLVTSIVTGVHILYLASAILWGAPLNPLHCVCFLGSVLLLFASVRAPFVPRTGAKIALAGSIAAWCFYVPVIVVSSLMPFAAWRDIRISASSGIYAPVVGFFGGPILLVATTIYTIFVLKRPRQSS